MSAARLALGTLTILPVPPPESVDRRTAGRAMVLAPLVGLLLGLVTLALATLAALAGGHRSTPHTTLVVGDRATDLTGPPTLLIAVVVVALLAVLTRAMHLDGLADTADGLGSGREADAALEVMRRGDIGPFGVVAVLLALLVQVAALERLLTRPQGFLAFLLALTVSRLVLPLLCSRGVPAARPDGLGAMVAGTVGRRALAGSALLAVVALALVAAAGRGLSGPVDGLDEPGAWGPLRLAATTVLPLLAAALLARRCVRRLGGITGDVLGACVEVALTVGLLVAAI